MNLPLLNIPEEVTQLPDWLEGHLMGPDLGELVAELHAVLGPPNRVRDLTELLGSYRQQILDHGLRDLPPEAIRQLLQQPALLLELQELVLLDGGDYWTANLDVSAEGSSDVQRRWTSIESALSADSAPSSKTVERAPRREEKAQSRRLVVPCTLSALAAAAALLLVASATGVLRFGPQEVKTAGVSWGWMADDAMPQSMPADEYLDQLAGGAGAWFKKRPADKQALAQRISEFRQGCSRLILSQHAPLEPDDRTWLVDKCKAWASALDDQLAAIEAADSDLADVLSATDEIIERLRDALQQRAQGLRSGESTAKTPSFPHRSTLAARQSTPGALGFVRILRFGGRIEVAIRLGE